MSSSSLAGEGDFDLFAVLCQGGRFHPGETIVGSTSHLEGDVSFCPCPCSFRNTPYRAAVQQIRAVRLQFRQFWEIGRVETAVSCEKSVGGYKSMGAYQEVGHNPAARPAGLAVLCPAHASFVGNSSIDWGYGRAYFP